MPRTEIVQSYRGIKQIIPIFEVTAWSGWSNQPTGDNFEVVSNNAGDTQKVTVWYSVTGSSTIVNETLTLTGTTAVSNALATVDKVYGIFLGDKYGNMSARATGTITLRKKTGALAITTITAGKLCSGSPYFYLPGCNVEIENIAGNTWFNTVKDATLANPVLATTTGPCVQLTGRMSKLTKVNDYVSIISDGTGSTVQILVYEG